MTRKGWNTREETEKRRNSERPKPGEKNSSCERREKRVSRERKERERVAREGKGETKQERKDRRILDDAVEARRREYEETKTESSVEKAQMRIAFLNALFAADLKEHADKYSEVKISTGNNWWSPGAQIAASTCTTSSAATLQAKFKLGDRARGMDQRAVAGEDDREVEDPWTKKMESRLGWRIVPGQFRVKVVKSSRPGDRPLLAERDWRHHLTGWPAWMTDFRGCNHVRSTKSNGDCLFDSIAKAFNVWRPNETWDSKKIRELAATNVNERTVDHYFWSKEIIQRAIDRSHLNLAKRQNFGLVAENHSKRIGCQDSGYHAAERHSQVKLLG